MVKDKECQERRRWSLLVYCSEQVWREERCSHSPVYPSLKTWLKHAYLHRSIDVKFILDSARLGLSSSANILNIADIALRVVFLLFLPCF